MADHCRFIRPVDYSLENYRNFGKYLLFQAQQINKELGIEGFKRIASNKDLVLKADIEISKKIRELSIKSGIEGVLFTEEFGRLELAEKPRTTIVFDDIDGTFNKGDGKGVLPYCSIVAISDSPTPKYSDFAYAGIVIHNSSDLFEAVRGQGVFKNGKRITGQKVVLDEETRLYFGLYDSVRKCPNIVSKLLPLIARTRCGGDLLSAGVSFALVAQHGGAYISMDNKAHEAGAGYLFMGESGGTILDLEGKDLGPRDYIFDGRVPVVASNSLNIILEIMEELKNTQKVK